MRCSPSLPSCRRVSPAVLAIALVSLAPAPPPAGADVPPGFDRVVILATNSAHLQQNSEVASGDVAVNESSPGPTLASQRELVIGIGARTPAGYAVAADRIQVEQNAQVGGDVSCNDLDDATGTVSCAPLGLPVFPGLPPFVEQEPRAGAPDVLVAHHGTATLSPGDYGVIDVDHHAVVTFEAGIYNVGTLDAGHHTALEFKGPTQLRVAGRLAIGQHSFAGPAPGSGVAAGDVVVYVAGVNGSSGALGATPKAAHVGTGTELHANLYVPNGTLRLRQNSHSTGAFVARDVDLGIGARVTLASYWADRPPVADPQTVFTDGPAAIEILLTGSDPEGGDLTFSIAVAPSEGVLSALAPVVPPAVRRCSASGVSCSVDADCPEFPAESCEEHGAAVTSATVTYTPDTGEDREDAFTFQVADPAGGIGQAVVSINPPGDPTPPPVPLDTVEARGGAAATSKDTAIALRLEGAAPCDGLCDGVGADGDSPLSFGIVSFPAHGDLGPVVPGAQVPQRNASVTYTPDPGFVSPPADSFAFEACGTVGGALVCDQATMTVTVFEPQTTADDQKVATQPGQPVEIVLTGTPGVAGTETQAGGVRVLIGRAAFLAPAAVAGNVADADGDGFGDNHNDLPGPAPVLMSAGVDQTGGAGSNGTVRMQIEWDLSSVDVGQLESAQVLLHTQKGTVDSLDTVFFAGGVGQDGALADGDFEAPVEQLPGVVMPVPAGPAGTEGTFSFDVLARLQAALDAGQEFFSIQGRVDEDLAGPARGLQVYTTADGAVAADKQPFLSIATPGVTPPPLTFTVLTLPASGTLFDAFENPVLEVPAELPSSRLTYVPAVGFSGVVEFLFRASDGLTFADGLIGVIVGSGFGFGDCQDDVLFCDDGRP